MTKSPAGLVIRGKILKKITWSQMIPNRQIRRDMQKKKFFAAAENGGGGGPAAVFYERYQNLG